MTTIVTYGMGSNNIITRGFAGGEIVVIKPKISEGGGTLVYRKGVVGRSRDQQGKVTIRKPLFVKGEFPFELLAPLNITKITKIKILEKIEKFLSNKTEIGIMSIKSLSSTNVDIKYRHIQKKDDKIDIKLQGIRKFIEKAVEIKQSNINLKDKKETIINQFDLLDDIEKAELLDLIEDIEDEGL